MSDLYDRASPRIFASRVTTDEMYCHANREIVSRA